MRHHLSDESKVALPFSPATVFEPRSQVENEGGSMFGSSQPLGARERPGGKAAALKAQLEVQCTVLISFAHIDGAAVTSFEGALKFDFFIL